MSSGLYNTHKIDFDTTLDLTRLKPYGDTMNDGKVQTSFTLPVKDDERGEEAARQIAKKMGLEEPNVAYHSALDKEFTFYVVYGSCVHSVNYEDIHVITVESDVMSMEETNDYIREHIGRKVVMVGASTGTDAHTVGIDAIMNRKGFAGHYGLERYEMIEAYNLGSQVPNEDFIKKALELHADVLLVSQTVTQKDVHIQNLTNLIELLEAEGLRDKFVVCCGGPRITHELAKERPIWLAQLSRIRCCTAISCIWPSFKAHEGAFNCHIQNNIKRRVSNPLWKAYSSFFSEQLFCSVSLFTSSGACRYGWPALCQWFAAPVPAAPAESPPPASPGTYSGNSRSRWQSCPGRRRR